MAAIRTIEELRNRCIVDDITGCWRWTGAQNDGLPCVWHPEQNQKTKAGRLVAWLVTGKLPKAGRIWYCTCDDRLCMNPAHFKSGTVSQMWKAIRPKLDPLHRAKIINTRRKSAKTNQAVIDAIRASEASHAEEARKHGIDSKTVWRYRNVEAVTPNSVFGWRP